MALWQTFLNRLYYFNEPVKMHTSRWQITNFECVVHRIVYINTQRAHNIKLNSRKDRQRFGMLASYSIRDYLVNSVRYMIHMYRMNAYFEN